jgi:rhodanese-related sulfurtransferase
MRFCSLLFLIFITSSCKSQNSQTVVLNAGDFKKAITDSNVQILDVRTLTEFQSGHIKNALLADWNNSVEFKEKIQYIDKGKTVYVYCLAGSRSNAAAEWMRKNGFSNVIELKGGVNAWKKAGNPLENAVAQKQISLAEYETWIPAEGIALVDVGAAWCPPCVKMKPVVEELQQDTSLHFKLVNIDAGVHTAIMQQLEIESIPSFIIYKNKKMVWKKEGIVSKQELLDHLK